MARRSFDWRRRATLAGLAGIGSEIRLVSELLDLAQGEGGLDVLGPVQGTNLVAEVSVQIAGAGMEGGGDDVGLTSGGRREAHLGMRGEGAADAGEGSRGDGEPEHGDDVVSEVLVVEPHVQVEDPGRAQVIQSSLHGGFGKTGACLEFRDGGSSVAAEDGEQCFVGVLQCDGAAARIDRWGAEGGLFGGTEGIDLAEPADGASAAVVEQAVSTTDRDDSWCALEAVQESSSRA